MSVSAEDLGIASIPLVTLNAMWDKASELLSDQKAITPAPGNDPTAIMVLSRSLNTPHHVSGQPDGQYVCDPSCQICSHTLAVAEQGGALVKFLEWFLNMDKRPNLSTLGLSGLPKGRGQKGGRDKRQRSRSSIPLPDNYSVRPGCLVTTFQLSNCQVPATVPLSVFQPPQDHAPYPSPCVSTYLVPYGLQRPFTQENLNPFYLKSLTGNIRVCQR